MRLRVIIPLPWYSKQAYDICRDELRGGWRVFAIYLQVTPAPKLLKSVGFVFTFQMLIGVKFKREVRPLA